jgi:hypothetical protein
MAAILTDRPSSPRAGSPAGGFFSTSRVRRRDPIDLSGMLQRAWNVTWQGLLLLWMLTVMAFSLLVVAGAMGLLG